MTNQHVRRSTITSSIPNYHICSRYIDILYFYCTVELKIKSAEGVCMHSPQNAILEFWPLKSTVHVDPNVDVDLVQYSTVIECICT